MLIGDEKYAMSGGLRLWTERFGDQAHPTVLLVMGTSAQAMGWPDQLIERLLDSGRQVIRFDHRDTGYSDCIHGTEDPIFAVPHAESLAAQVPGARLHVIRGMGHNLFSPGLPEQIADLIVDNTAT